MEEPREEYFHWTDGVYALIDGREIIGPFDDLDEAIVKTALPVTVVLRFGESVLMRREESSYGLDSVDVLRHENLYALCDSVSDESDGPFESIEEAVRFSHVLQLSESTESIESTELSTEEIIKLLRYEYVEVTGEKFVEINNTHFLLTDIYKRRWLPTADEIAATLRQRLIEKRDSLKADLSAPPLPPLTYRPPPIDVHGMDGSTNQGELTTRKSSIETERTEALAASNSSR